MTPTSETRPDHTRAKRLVMVIILTLASLYAFGPSLCHAWLMLDDVNAVQNPLHRWFLVGSAAGRPGLGLWYYAAYGLQQDPQLREIANIGFRLLQILAHTAASIVGAYLLWQASGSRLTALAILPFLVWGFAADPVTWLAAGVYPLSALLAMAGLMCALAASGKHAWLWWISAFLLSAMAPLMVQPGAMIGLATALVVLAVCTVRGKGKPPRKPFYALLVIGLATTLGGVISLHVAKSVGSSRAHLAPELMERLDYLVDMNRYVLFHPQYPSLLTFSHGAVLAGALIALIVAASRGWRSGSRRVAPWLIVFVSLCLTCVVPYAASLATAERWPSARVLYVGPMALVASWALLMTIAGPRLRYLLAVTLVVTTAIPHTLICHSNSKAFVQTFRNDLETLHAIEDFAHRHNYTRVIPVTYHDSGIATTWNPYRLPYPHFQSRGSNFQFNWAARYLINLYSSLTPIQDPCAVQICRRCRGQEVEGDPALRTRVEAMFCDLEYVETDAGFAFFALPDCEAVCVCAP